MLLEVMNKGVSCSNILCNTEFKHSRLFSLLKGLFKPFALEYVIWDKPSMGHALGVSF